MKDSKNTIFKSAKHFLSGTLISRCTGLLRDVTMAFAFGTTGSIAALMIAFRFSHMFRRLLGEGAFQMAFIPQFESLRNVSPSRAINFFRSLTITLSCILFAISLTSSAALSYFYLASNLSEGIKEVLLLTAILMPGLFFICLYGLNSALLQCEQSYFTPSVAPVAFNLIWIVGALSLMQLPAANAAPWLAGFIVLACAGQWLITLPKTVKIYRTYLKKSANSPSGESFFSCDLKKLFKPLTLSIVGVAATQINNAMDPLFARFAESEGPAYLWYAIRLQQFPLGLFGIALSSAILPPLSRAIKNGQIEKYKSFIEIAIRRSLLFMIPISFAYFIAGDTCVNLLFGHGDFNVESVAATTLCLSGYTVGLIPCALTLILAPGFYALNNYRAPTVITALSVILNMILNSVFILFLGMGAASVALATGISAWVNCACLWYTLKREIGLFTNRSVTDTILKSIAASIVGVTLVLGSDYLLLNGNGATAIITGAPLQIPRNFPLQLLCFFVEACSFGIPVAFIWLQEFGFVRMGDTSFASKNNH